MSGNDSLLGQARALLGQGRGAEAAALLRPLCERAPQAAEPWFLLGAAEHLSGRLPAALAAFEQAVRAGPRHVQAANARAAMLHLLGRRAEALQEYERVHALAPGDARILVNLGIVLEESGRPHEALARYDAAVAIDSGCFAARLNRSALRLRLGLVAEALEDADRAVAIDPAACEGYCNKAQALLAADRCEEALIACARALERDPGSVGAQFHRALALACLGQLAESARAFAQARAHDPQVFDAMVRAAYAAARVPAAGDASAACPDPRVIYLVRGVDRLTRCEWSGRERFLERFAELVRDGHRRGEPVCERSLVFHSLFLPLERDVVHALAAAAADEAARAAPRLPALTRMPRARGEPLRLGILSAGFRRYPNAFLLAPVLQALDRRRVRAFGYALNPPDASPEARWLAASFDAVRMAHALDDAALAQQIRADGIDILLDVANGFDYARPAVLAARPAPLAACYLGGLVPSGASWIDYRIGDADGMPDADEFAPERLLRLPRSCWTYDTGPLVLGRMPSRTEVGLPPAGAVLCAFGGAYKLDPEMFRIWMRVLEAVPGSVLWLLGEGAVERNLRAQASAHGIAPQRLVFAPRTGLEAHLARLALADLYLDTLPCNAHTTALEALQRGVPVLTVRGTTAAGRVGASIVRAAGLGEFVAVSLREYEARAIAFASDLPRLAAAKRFLRETRASCLLWDAAGLARELERALEAMWARHEAGLAPAALDMAAA